jgi:predicted dehydrogenase
VTATVALIGVGGHGRAHRRTIAELESAGVVRLVALCDVAPVDDAPPGVAVYRDHIAMIDEIRPDIVIACTPPHTHLSIASAALCRGCDVLLEKPPVLNVAEHHALADVVEQTGRVCQVGFQALASPALAELLAAIERNELGPLQTVTAVGAWKRDDSYYRRGSWVGRRRVDGTPVLDGALANPFAHAVMQVLAIVRSHLVTVEVERYRTRDIEVDDTAALRLTFASGVRALVAVTLCAEEFVPGEITVTGTDGAALLEYPTDRLQLPGDAGPRWVPGRQSLLANLVAHRIERSTALVAPLSRTLAFTELLEPITASPVTPVDEMWVVSANDLPHPRRVISGINGALGSAAQRLALFSELAVPWAMPPVRAANGHEGNAQ